MVSHRVGNRNMNIFKTKEEATVYAVEQFGALQVEMQCINVIKVGPTITRFLKCETGFAVCEEVRARKEELDV